MALILQPRPLFPAAPPSDASSSPAGGLVRKSAFSGRRGSGVCAPAGIGYARRGRHPPVFNPRLSTRISCLKQPGTIPNVGIVTEQTWQKLVLESDIPVLIDFWAPWCGPCRTIAPTVNELADEYAGRLTCFTLNTDDCPNLATEYGVRSIPTIMVFERGEKKDAIIGAVPKSTLRTAIDKCLGV